MSKRCSCGRVHASWTALPFVGVQFADVPEEALSLRNCPDCGSTMAVPVVDDPATCPTLPPDAVLAAHLGAELLS